MPQKLHTNLKQKAAKSLAANKTLIQQLKKKEPGELDSVAAQLHDKAFEHIDCLQCANCCRSLGPRLTDIDIARLAKHVKQKPSEFTSQYLRIDEDGDYVFKQMPCPFLQPDNYCAVYPERPKACREYPHTNRRRFVQILDLSLKNTSTCPAVFEVFEGLRKVY